MCAVNSSEPVAMLAPICATAMLVAVCVRAGSANNEANIGTPKAGKIRPKANESRPDVNDAVFLMAAS
jgi:hypothetical protein